MTKAWSLNNTDYGKKIKFGDKDLSILIGIEDPQGGTDDPRRTFITRTQLVPNAEVEVTASGGRRKKRRSSKRIARRSSKRRTTRY